MKKLDVVGVGMTSQRTRDRLVKRLRLEGIKNEAVLEVMRHVPRHLFVDTALASRAYEDSALPIAYGQTISQPWVVARMTELLLEPCVRGFVPEKILEVGTGSGYQVAVLAGLVNEVYTVEIIKPLYQQTQQLLQDLGYTNIHSYLADGHWGWSEAAPYDAIIVTAAPEQVPETLLQQLKVGGHLVIPVGTQYRAQSLQRITRVTKDNYNTESLNAVQFVPLTGNK